MKSYKIFSILMKNNGLSLDNKFNLIKNANFIVSLPDFETIIPKTIFSLDLLEIILKEYKKTINFINKKQENKANYIIGFWIENNQIYVDISISVDTREIAIKLGKLYKQKAIYYFKTKEVIKID